MPTVAECLKVFENALVARGHSATTQKTYSTKVKLFVDWYTAHQKKPLSKANMNDLNAFIAFRQQKSIERDKTDQPNMGRLTKERGRLSGSAIYAYQGPLKLFFATIWPDHELSKIKTVKLKPVVPTLIQANELCRRVGRKNIEAYYAEHGSKSPDFYSMRDWCLLAFILDTGARISAARGLKHSDLFLAGPKPYARITSKGKTIAVPLSPFWTQIYKEYMATTHESVNVFTTVTGSPLNTGYLGGIISRHTGYYPHKFRHFYAVTKLENTHNIKTVQKLLGHSDVRTTSRYLDVVVTGEEASTATPLGNLLGK